MVFLFLSEGGDMSKKNTLINYQIILLWEPLKIEMGSGGSAGKESNCNAGDWVPPLGRENPLGEGMATHSSILVWDNSRDTEAQWATVHGIAKSWTRLNH